MEKITHRIRDIKAIISMEEKHAKEYCSSLLSKIYGSGNLMEKGNFLFVPGNIKILLVAHLDVVHNVKNKIVLYDEGMFWSPSGLGADDRAGVYSILKIIHCTGLRPGVLLTLGEERGCVGANEFVGCFPTNKFNYDFLLELDRHGSDDAAMYSCFGKNREFDDMVGLYGYKPTRGSITDISVIMREWELCGANLSIGYYNEHSGSEYLVESEMLNTIKNTIKIITNHASLRKNKQYKFILEKFDRYREDCCFKYKNPIFDDIFSWDRYYRKNKLGNRGNNDKNLPKPKKIVPTTKTPRKETLETAKYEQLNIGCVDLTEEANEIEVECDNLFYEFWLSHCKTCEVRNCLSSCAAFANLEDEIMDIWAEIYQDPTPTNMESECESCVSVDCGNCDVFKGMIE